MKVTKELPKIIPLEDYWINKIPSDEYEPAYHYIQHTKSTPDSIANGHYIWRRCMIGYVGKMTGIMLSPEWGEVLEQN